MSDTFTITRTLNSVSCCHSGCGVVFGIESHYDNTLRRSHAWFYCPNGHVQHYTAKSDVEKAQDEAAAAKHDAEWVRQLNERLQSNLKSERHKVAAERGAKTKLKKRIANGVCPCCKRHFANVAAHMLSKHPEQVKK